MQGSAPLESDLMIWLHVAAAKSLNSFIDDVRLRILGNLRPYRRPFQNRQHLKLRA